MNRRHVIALAVGLLGCAALLGVVLASVEVPAIEWWVLGAGGGPATAGAVSINDTLGQPLIGPSSEGSLSLHAGYWYEAALPELAIIKSAQPSTADPGQIVTYTIVITNSGDVDATGAVVSDTMPGGLTFSGPLTLDPPGAGTTGTPPILVYDTTIASADSITVTFPATVNACLAPGTLITNTAAISCSEVTAPIDASIAISVANVAPALGALEPVSGSGPISVTTYFTTTYMDANGWDDLRQCYFHIGKRKSLVGNVTLFYHARKNEVRLRTDDGADWSAPCTPGSGDVLENSQAKVYCAQVTVAPSADTVTTGWAIEFKFGYSGEKKLGVKAKDAAGDKAKGQWKGTWTIIE